MFMRSRLFMLLILPLAPIAITKQAYAQKVSLEIGNVYRNDAQTKKSPDGKSRVIAVSHEFRFGSSVAVKLVEIVATLEIVNSDGSRTRAVKNIRDGTSNALNTESFNIQTPDGVFARDFKLTLKGKFRLGDAADLIERSAVKTGSFPAPANFIERKG
jgi:hypothetical protein